LILRQFKIQNVCGFNSLKSLILWFNFSDVIRLHRAPGFQVGEFYYPLLRLHRHGGLQDSKTHPQWPLSQPRLSDTSQHALLSPSLSLSLSLFFGGWVVGLELRAYTHSTSSFFL
jgi:hypothetical protein